MSEIDDKIREWSSLDLDGLMVFIRQYWKYAEIGYFEKSEDGIYHLSTAGWSDNEEIISVMQENYVWWVINWLSSRRGGHYEFGRKDAKSNDKPCAWTLGAEYGSEIWETDCGDSFIFEDGSPKENGFKFCPYCGMEIIENKEEDDEYS